MGVSAVGPSEAGCYVIRVCHRCLAKLLLRRKTAHWEQFLQLGHICDAFQPRGVLGGLLLYGMHQVAGWLPRDEHQDISRGDGSRNGRLMSRPGMWWTRSCVSRFITPSWGTPNFTMKLGHCGCERIAWIPKEEQELIAYQEHTELQEFVTIENVNRV